MERVENDKRQPEETWAHYITRRIGRENFDKYRILLVGANDIPPEKEGMVVTLYYPDSGEMIHKDLQLVSLDSAINNCNGYDIGIAENIVLDESIETFKQTKTTTGVSIGKLGEDSFVLAIEIKDDVITVDGYDPTIVPSEFVASIESYKKHEDIQTFVDDLVAGIKKMLEGGD